jgi:hypothetical protein
MTNDELLKRIEELEQRVRSLEARPVYVPMPYPISPAPVYPTYPQNPWWSYPIVTCGPNQSTSNGTLTG